MGDWALQIAAGRPVAEFMQYFKRHWDDSRGDTHADWGDSTWYFETEPDMWPCRQIEVYAHGAILKYDLTHIRDAFGGLSEVPLDAAEYAQFAISREEFEQVWCSQGSSNNERMARRARAGN
jgi:hypothetical protein